MNRAARRKGLQQQKAEAILTKPNAPAAPVKLESQPSASDSDTALTDDSTKEFSDISTLIKILDVTTEAEVFDVACHPRLPLVATGLITGELHLYRIALTRAAPSMIKLESTAEQSANDDGDDDDNDDSDDAAPQPSITNDNDSIKDDDSVNDSDAENDDDDESSAESEADVSIDPILESNAFAPPALVFSACAHTGSIRALRWSKDGSRLYTASSDKSIAVFAFASTNADHDSKCLTLLHTITDAHTSAINVLRLIGANNDLLVTGDDDGYVKVHSTANNDYQCLASFAESGDYVSDMAAVGTNTNTTVTNESGHTVTINTSHHVVAVSGDGHLQVYDIRPHQSKWFAQSDHIDDDLLSVCYVRKKKGKPAECHKLLVGSKTNGIFAFTVPYYGASDEHVSLTHSADTIIPVDSDNDMHNLILVGSSDGMVSLVSLWPHHTLAIIGKHSNHYPIEAMSLSPAIAHSGVERRFLVSVGHDKKMKFWDVSKLMAEGWALTQEEDEDAEDSDDDDSDTGEQPDAKPNADADSDDSDSASAQAVAPVDSERARVRRAKMIASIKQRLAIVKSQHPTATNHDDGDAGGSDGESDSDPESQSAAVSRKRAVPVPSNSCDPPSKRVRSVAPPKPRTDANFFSGFG